MTRLRPSISWKDTVLARRPRVRSRRRRAHDRITSAVAAGLVLAAVAMLVAVLVYFFSVASPALHEPDSAPSKSPTLPPLY